MTDTPASTLRRPRRRLSIFGVVSASLASFFAVLTLLSWQMAQGNDPALGAGETPKRPVLERRIELERIVEDPPAPAPAIAAGTDGGVAAADTSAATAPATTAPASPAPAPAPAPAPVSTGGS
jgi:hypothetical protein